MANILYVLENLHSTNPRAQSACQLIELESNSQHMVTVVTAFDTSTEYQFKNPYIRVYRPFRNWTAWEVLRNLPFLIQLRPEVVHIFQPFNSSSKTLQIFLWLSHAFKGLNRSVLYFSFFDSIFLNWTNKKCMRHFNHFDLIFCRNLHDQRLLTKKVLNHKHKVVHLPELSPSSPPTRSHWINKETSYKISIPFTFSHLKLDRNVLTTLEEFLQAYPLWTVVLPEGWGNLSLKERKIVKQRWIDKKICGQWVVLSHLTEEEKNGILFSSQLVILCTNKDRFLVSYLARLLAHHHVPTILHKNQAQGESSTWQHSVNAFLVTNTAESLYEKLAVVAMAPHKLENVKANLGDQFAQAHSDDVINKLNRAYASTQIT